MDDPKHNNPPNDDDAAGGPVAAQLRAFIERVERMEEEKAARMADIREIYAEAKATGYDPKVMRKVVALRKMDSQDRSEQAHVLETYCAALGMQMSLL